MNPISSDIFGRLGWLTRQLKNLLGRVYNLEQSSGDCNDCPVATDGTTITGNGTVASPLVAVAPPAPYTTLVLGNVIQAGINDPTFTILENTTGETYTFTRNTDGDYSINASSGTPFTTGKVGVLISNGDSVSLLLGSVVRYGFVSSTEIKIFSEKPGGLFDGILRDATIEIKIYP